jgi:hypothetical protein
MLALFAACPSACDAQQKMGKGTVREPRDEYDTPGVQLEGKLEKRKVYGPPGYGETPAQDERSIIIILKLLHPITVGPVSVAAARNNPNAETFKHVHEIQLFIPRESTSDVDRMVGGMVVASGVLNQHVAPSNYTDVWMAVKTVSPR